MSVVPVFFVSLATLSFEVLLSRAFAMTQWSHLAFLVISIALFGYSAGGLTIHIWLKKAKPVIQASAPWIPLLLAFVIPISWICTNAIPFDSIQLPFSGLQVLYLCVLYVLLSVPFFFAGYITAYLFSQYSGKTGFIYAAAMTGSACGALIPAIFLPIIGFPGCIIVAGCASSLPVAASTPKRRLALLLTVGTCALITALSLFPSLLEPRPSSYKELVQMLRHPGAAVTYSAESIHGRVDVLESPSIRYAPGLSLTFSGTIPPQEGIFVDNGGSLAITRLPLDEMNLIKQSLAGAALAVVENPSEILVPVVGGGNLLLSAVSTEGAHVTILDQIPDRAEIVAQSYSENAQEVRAVPLRIAIRRLKGPFDIIAVDHSGSSNPSLLSIHEDYILTAESIGRLFRALESRGVLMFMRRLQVPPSDSLKVTATAFRALERNGIPRPGQHLAMIRSWDMYVLLVGKQPLGGAAITALRSFVDRNAFDLVFLPEMQADEANRFNRRPIPAHYQSMQLLVRDLDAGDDTFIDSYYMNIRAATDNRPFINRTIKWRKIKELYHVTGERFYTMLFAGEVLIAAAFGIALILSFAFFVIPAAISIRSSMSSDQGNGAFRTFGILAVFLLLGTGYMFFEIAWVKKLILLAGGASLSFTTVLAVVLICSGLGGMLSQELSCRHILPLAFAVSAFVVLSALSMETLIPLLSQFAHPWPLVLACILLAPPAIFLGMPLPLTMQWICRSARMRVLGWVANGVASVISSIAAAALALFGGILELLLMAAGAYAVVCISMFFLIRSPRIR